MTLFVARNPFFPQISMGFLGFPFGDTKWNPFFSRRCRALLGYWSVVFECYQRFQSESGARTP